jgi:hypothetical protein
MGHEHDDNRDQPDMSQRDEEALWRSIVDNYGDRVSLETDGAPTDPPAAPPEAAVAPPRPRREEAAESRDWLDAYDDPDDHFVPPEPDPVPTPEPPRLLAWAGVFGVPVVVLLLVVLQVTLPPWGSLLCLAWFVGGFGYLIATMRRESGPDDDWDDGARL